MKTIIVDDQSFIWSKDRNLAESALRCVFSYCKDVLRYRGYIYLNQIYEQLGANWNPDDENICYRSDGKPLEFEHDVIGSDVYCIHII